MIVLSLFDGMSVAQQALKELGIIPEVYYASEIDKYVIAVTQKNFPNTVQLGSVTEVKGSQFEHIDLLIGGSPCVDLSIAKRNRKGLEGTNSSLFWEYFRILNETKPKYFVFENVASMRKEDKEIITEALSVEPIMIDAALVSAQSRKRLFWVGKLVNDKYEKVNMLLPEDKNILLKDILEENVDDKYYITGNHLLWLNNEWGYTKIKNSFIKINDKKLKTLLALDYNNQSKQIIKLGYLNNNYQGNRVYSIEGKSPTLCANSGGLGKNGLYFQENKIRKLTPVEYLRLQSMPDDYFDNVFIDGKLLSDNQKYKMCGNAFNCEVIKHILTNLLT